MMHCPSNGDTPIDEVVQLILNRGIHRLPVMPASQLVGILTRRDFRSPVASSQ
ncbi:MAG: CBS domain-containing protein [Chloroflexi bacterium]|nr:CBS domain-containing protein [Chloroflexota bacterium]